MRGKPNEEFIRSIIMDPQQEPSAYLKRLSKGFGKAFDSETRGHLHVVSIFEKEQSETIKEVEVSDAGTEVCAFTLGHIMGSNDRIVGQKEETDQHRKIPSSSDRTISDYDRIAWNSPWRFDPFHDRPL